MLVENGCKCVGEGANMPSTNEAIRYFLDHGVSLLPAKAANAGGVAVSALEMSQNAVQLYRSFEDVDNQLQQIMAGIYRQIDDASREYGMEGNYAAGANIAGFTRVVRVMMAQGYV